MPADRFSLKQIELTLGLDEPDDDVSLRFRLAKKLGCAPENLPPFYVAKRAIDARFDRVCFKMQLQLGTAAPLAAMRPLQQVRWEQPSVLIVGDGPAGLFCAYELARHGVASTVIDRGKPVQPRRKDLRGLNQFGIVDPDSNYCFGEGGAGTYSDGKLYTRATKRGDVDDVLQVLVSAGAPADILVDARPHIGSNRLPKVVTALRQALENVGVKFLFEQKVVGVTGHTASKQCGVLTASGDTLEGAAVVLATGHSAADVYEFLHKSHVALQAKPFAMGVRLEHPQSLINEIQYGRFAGHARLPAAYYKLVENITVQNEPDNTARGVFSFCMCPGGFIVPASTAPGHQVVNGMSLSRRDSPFANSGFVVSITEADLFRCNDTDPLIGLRLQHQLETAAYQHGGGALVAPATRLTDFMSGKPSTTVTNTSYQPGLSAGNIAEVLDSVPLRLHEKLHAALTNVVKKIPRFHTDQANLIGVESRTSSPVRIVRDAQTLQSVSHPGLYPCAEGAGYAGGIISAALDGIRVAQAIVRSHTT